MSMAHRGRVVPTVKGNELTINKCRVDRTSYSLLQDKSFKIINVLVKVPSQKTGIQYPFSLSPLHIDISIS